MIDNSWQYQDIIWIMRLLYRFAQKPSSKSVNYFCAYMKDAASSMPISGSSNHRIRSWFAARSHNLSLFVRDLSARASDVANHLSGYFFYVKMS
jgi:hypothetical protein